VHSSTQNVYWWHQDVFGACTSAHILDGQKGSQGKKEGGSSFVLLAIYLWRKVVCFVLFCSYEIHWAWMLQIVFLVSLESSRQGGVHGLMISTCDMKVLEYWMISSLKIKINCSWKFWRNWNVPLVLLERFWWAVFNGIYLVRFGFRIVGDIWFFKWFLCH